MSRCSSAYFAHSPAPTAAPSAAQANGAPVSNASQAAKIVSAQNGITAMLWLNLIAQ